MPRYKRWIGRRARARGRKPPQFAPPLTACLPAASGRAASGCAAATHHPRLCHTLRPDNGSLRFGGGLRPAAAWRPGQLWQPGHAVGVLPLGRQRRGVRAQHQPRQRQQQLTHCRCNRRAPKSAANASHQYLRCPAARASPLPPRPCLTLCLPYPPLHPSPLQVITPFNIYFNSRLILQKHELWRIVTNFFYFGNLGAAVARRVSTH